MKTISTYSLIFVFTAMLTLIAWGQNQKPADTSSNESKAQTEQTQEAPATQPAAPVPEVVALLKRLEQAGKLIKSLQADIRYKTVEGIQKATTIQFGSIAFYNGDAPAFHIHFDRTLINGVGNTKQKKFIFKDRWLAEIDLHRKSFTRHELYEEGKQFNPFDFSKGLFPLPFGQKASKISELFDITLLKAEEGQVHFKLSAKAKQAKRFDFTHATFTLDKKTLAPILIQTEKTKLYKSVTGGEKERVLKSTEIKFFDGKTKLNNMGEQEIKLMFNTLPTEKHNGWTIQVKRIPPPTPQPKSIDQTPKSSE